MLVIYRKKDSTAYFENLWKDIDKVTLLDRTVITTKRLNSLMDHEKELVLICGEGDASGLYKPNWDTHIWLTDDNKSKLYMVSKTQASIIHSKSDKEKTDRNIPVVCLWTYSNEFMKANNLFGFGLSDFYFTLSDIDDIDNYGQLHNADIVTEANVFINRMNKILKSYINHVRGISDKDYNPIYKWLRVLQDEAGNFSTGFIRHNYFTALKYISSTGKEYSKTEDFDLIEDRKNQSSKSSSRRNS